MNPFSYIVRVSKGLGACLALVRDPSRLDQVHHITNAIATKNPEKLEKMRQIFTRHPAGARALDEKRRLAPDTRALLALPSGSLGHEFARHFTENGLDDKNLPAVAAGVQRPQGKWGEELRFIRAHIYETHDVWHVITGFGVDVAGELGLQAFCAAQTKYPLPTLLLGLGLLNTAIFCLEDSTNRMEAISAGWQMGRHAQPLFGHDWSEYWETPLDDVRRQFDVTPYSEWGGAPLPARKRAPHALLPVNEVALEGTTLSIHQERGPSAPSAGPCVSGV